MTTVYNVNANWPAIHEAFRKLDEVRRGSDITPMIGYDQVVDALGGSYFPAHYERQGLAGLVCLVAAEGRIRQDAWERVHARKSVLREIRVACAVVLALDEVNRLLAETGLEARAGVDVICGTDGTHVALTGLCWLVGMRRDDRRVPLAAVRGFVADGDLSRLKAALQVAPVDEAVYTNL